MKQLTRAVALGIGASLLALSGCQKDLHVDGVLYECESDDECGPGYTCEQDPQHGQVCLSEKPQVTPDADSGPDSTTDADDTEGDTSPPQPLVVTVTNESPHDLRRVRVYLFDAAQSDCAQLTAHRATSQRKQVAELTDGAASAQVEFETVSNAVSVLATGMTEQGVRAAVGCQDDVAPPAGDQATTIEINLQKQLPIFAPGDYQMTVAWQLKDGSDPLGPFIRGLKRLPVEPGTALLGCKNASSSDVCDTPDEKGLLHLIAEARMQTSTGDEQQTANERHALLTDEAFRDALRTALNENANPMDLNVNMEGINSAAARMREGVVMRGRGSVGIDSIKQWNEGIPLSTDFSGKINFGEVGLDLCEGNAACAMMLASAPNDSVAIEFHNGQVTPDEIAFDGPTSATFAGFNFAAHYARVFAIWIYPENVAGDALGQTIAPSVFTDTRWPCATATESVGNDSSETEAARQLCLEITSDFAGMLADLYTGVAQRFPLTLHPSTTCPLAQPSYADGSAWDSSPIKPMPVFSAIGPQTNCEWVLEMADSEDGGATIANYIGVFGAQAAFAQ